MRFLSAKAKSIRPFLAGTGDESPLKIGEMSANPMNEIDPICLNWTDPTCLSRIWDKAYLFEGDMGQTLYVLNGTDPICKSFVGLMV